jgi:hypothetical protein
MCMPHDACLFAGRRWRRPTTTYVSYNSSVSDCYDADRFILWFFFSVASKKVFGHSDDERELSNGVVELASQSTIDATVIEFEHIMTTLDTLAVENVANIPHDCDSMTTQFSCL